MSCACVTFRLMPMSTILGRTKKGYTYKARAKKGPKACIPHKSKTKEYYHTLYMQEKKTWKK